MKAIFILTIFIGSFVCLQAQSPEVFMAKEILDEVSKKTQSYNTIQADFTFTLHNMQADVKDTHEGSILIKGDKFKVDLMGVESYSNGSTVWMYMKDVNEVNISDAEMMEDDIMNPSTIFSIYEEGFRYLHAGELTINGKTTDVIDLFPEDRDQPYSRIKLYIYRHNQHFARIEQIGKDGNNYIVEINQMKTNVPANDELFTFNTSKYAGIEVIDLR